MNSFWVGNSTLTDPEAEVPETETFGGTITGDIAGDGVGLGKGAGAGATVVEPLPETKDEN